MKAVKFFAYFENYNFLKDTYLNFDNWNLNQND